MDLAQMLTGLTIIAMLFGAIKIIVMLITKQNNKLIASIAIKEIKKSQLECGLHREEEMAKIKADIKVLQENDISQQLVIVKMGTTLEDLVLRHEKTQSMIMDTTKELIHTIQEMNKG